MELYHQLKVICHFYPQGVKQSVCLSIVIVVVVMKIAISRVLDVFACC